MSIHFQLDSVSQSFGATQALREISLTIEAKEKVAIIGPSGSGKSTLLRLLGTQISPTTGQLTALGKTPIELPPNELRELRSNIGYLPQSLGLVSNLRVLQNILNGRIGAQSLWSTLRSLISPKREQVEEAYKILDRVGIPEKLYDRTDSLSGGQQQRVAIARALFQNAQTLLADEPVSSIDPARSLDTIQLLNRLADENGFSLIVSIHDLQLAREYFPRIIGLRDGQVMFDSPPNELPESAFDQLFSVNRECTT